MKTRNDDRGSGVRLRKWALPVFGLACALILFTNCSTEERKFGTGNLNNNQDASANDDASVNAGTSGTGGGGTGGGGTGTSGAGTGGSGGSVNPPDSGAGDAGDLEGGAPQECHAKADGTPCGDMSGAICLHEVCGPSLCGDGYIDSAMGEECEDGNATPGDGCEPEVCKLSCKNSTDCDDSLPCNGVETCDTTLHHCTAGTPPDSADQVPCLRHVTTGGADAGTNDASAGDGGATTDGICKGGFCIVAGCGNHLVQAGEDCDDGNTDNADGCKIDCTFTCKADGDCDDHDICTGTESCNLTNHTCLAGTPLVCDDGNACTTDTCDPLLGCQTKLIDADGDGHAPDTLGACGDDCNDNDNTIYTGAGELCDGKDNDCDHSVDENAPIWYLDCDGDGYAEEGAFSTQTCNIPDPQPGCMGAGWTSRIPQNGNLSTLDCFDGNASVHPLPDPDSFYSTGIAGKSAQPFDWNCDGTEEKEPINTGIATNGYCGPPIIIGLLSTAAACNPLICITACTGAAGYVGSTLPACGSSAAYTYCSSDGGCHREYGKAVTHVERCR